MTAPLWTPSAERVAAANITAFARSVEQQWSVAAPDHQSLYNFSLAHPEAFWQSFWTFTNVRGTMGERVVEDFDRMPGARFFPDARLNFAENLLRRTDDRPAILFRGENGTDRSISARELYLAVGRFASALREKGVVAGDRVAAFIPNIPEAVIAALGTAAVGAVWSSSSPDFGVQGVVDRFGQIEPKVLVTADGHFYAGRTHDSLAKVRQVLDSIPSVARRSWSRSSASRLAWTACAAACCGASSSAPGPASRASSSCRSTIRSTSSIRRARPACPSASCTARAAR